MGVGELVGVAGLGGLRQSGSRTPTFTAKSLQRYPFKRPIVALWIRKAAFRAPSGGYLFLFVHNVHNCILFPEPRALTGCGAGLVHTMNWITQESATVAHCIIGGDEVV
jgi:hypothetical protein